MKYELYISIQNEYLSVPSQTIVKSGEVVDEWQVRGIASSFFGKSFMDTSEARAASSEYKVFIERLSDTVFACVRLYN